MNRIFKYIVSGACWLPILACSCVNQLSIDEEPETTQIPILFEDKGLQNMTYEKMTSPETGVYLVKGELEEVTDDGICNVPCRIEKKEITPTQKTFFPNEKEKLHVISYFPYQKNGFKRVTDSIRVDVCQDQSSSDSFLKSDFMVAQKENVTATTKKIPLEHRHQCATLSILLRTEKTSDLEKLYKAKPTLLLKNMHTSGTFAYNEGTFSLAATPKDLIPFGSWKKEGRKLTGMKAIVLPQTIAENTVFAELKLDGHTYSCRTPREFELIQGKENRITIDYDPLLGIDAISAEITDWEEGDTTEIIPEEIFESDTLDLEKIDFGQHPVYTVFHKGKEVLQLCREYIRTDEINGQAVVAYPIVQDTVDIKNGVVLNMTGSTSRIFGGRITWDKKTNTATYYTGFQSPIRYLFLDESVSLCLQKPAKTVQVYTLPLLLRDNRLDERNSYDLVKIGTQYWMQDNLATVYYNDNSRITHRTPNTYHKTTAAYFTHGDNLFYNKEAVLKGKLQPKGYRIPTLKDWDRLMDYIQHDASVLKRQGRWSNPDLPCSNLTGFDAVPIGIFAESNAALESIFDYEGIYLGLWSTNDVQNAIGEHVILISNRKRNIVNGTYGDYNGYSIRCIKE